MTNALKELNGLFEEAKLKQEFEFVLTLINYRSMGGKETTSNLHEWFQAIEFYKRLYYSLQNSEKVRIGCLLYSTFFENSDFYNIIGNLCNNILGYRASAYLYYKTKKNDRLLSTGEKINLVSEILSDCGKAEIIEFFDKNHQQEIRNTFFHSAYSISEGNYLLHDTETVFIDRVGTRSFSISDFLEPRIENVISFFDGFKKFYLDSFNSYKQDKVVSGFFHAPTDITIHGSDNGLIGFTIKNTTQFYGKWVDSGIYYDSKYDMWFGKNIRITFTDMETAEVNDLFERYERKAEIRISDLEFFNLVDRVASRKRTEELMRVIALLLRFGEIKFNIWEGETNIYKRKSLANIVLPYYRKALSINPRIKINGLDDRINQLEQSLL